MKVTRVPFVVLAVVILVLAGSLVYYWRIYKEPLPPEYLWGREGTLKLDLALERTEITVNESLNYTITITNTGKEKVRLYIGYFGAYARILDENNQTPAYLGPVMEPPSRPDDARFNSMMKVLEPGANYTEKGRFGNHSAGAGQHDLRPGHTYHVTAGYSCSEDRPYPALPHWLGEVSSEAKYFTVTG